MQERCMRRKIKLGMTLILLIGVILLSRKLSQVVTNEDVKIKNNVIVIDAGHGGEDPGKVAINGTLEKDVNLQIAKKIREKMEARGYDIVMTREEDVMDGEKLEDMKKRVELINKVNPVFAVSIHQNSFSDSEVRGAQVFYYADSEEGKEAASIMQEELLAMDSSNTRQIKANSDFFLLKKTNVPTIIVECGFLSNQEEAESLVTNEYQEQLAEAICAGIVKWLDK